MKRLVGIILLAAMLLPLAAVPVAADDGFDSVRLKWYEYLTGGADESAQTYVSNKIASLNSSAYYQWQRMNKEEGREYLFSELQDAEKSSQVTSVYNLLEIMAQAYATAGGVLYKNENLKKDLISALDWMHQNRYNKNVSEFDNWWDGEIGTPTKLNNIMVLLYDELDEATVKEYVSVIKYFAPDPKVCAQQMYPFESTAANRVSMCMVAALCGVLVKEGAAVEEASNALAPVFEYVTEGDGFYEDGSFIQHGRNPYNGGYGLGLLSSITDMIFLLGDSRWQVSESERVYEWFYNSFLPFTYDGLNRDNVENSL